jgi:hypothetical protein
MRFREKAQTINLVRTSATGGEPVVIGKLDRSNMELTPDLRGKLTPEEVIEVEQYITAKGSAHFVDQQYAALHFDETLEKVTEWLKVVPAEEAARFVEETHKSMRKLRQQLVKAANTSVTEGDD